MLYNIKGKLPYQGDQDYRDSLIQAIKTTLGDIPIDITLLESYGEVQIDVSNEDIGHLGLQSIIGECRLSGGDQGMLAGPRIIV